MSKQIANELKNEILEKRQSFLEAKIKRYPQDILRASNVHECDRFLVYSLLNWKDKELHNSGLQAIFDAGNSEENKVVKDLMDLGYVFCHQQMPFELKTRDGEVYCRGHIDGKIIYNEVAVPCEIKSMNMNTFGALNSIEDFKKKPLHRKYLRQMQLYLYGNNEEAGLFILSDLQGHYKVFTVELDYNEVEAILTKLEKAWNNAKNAIYPDPMDYDDKICGWCPYKHLCPNVTKFAGAELVEDADLEKMLNRRDELKPYYTEYDKVDKSIKRRFKCIETDIFIR